mmetsp:Transcript_19887/g.27568  ORF Transcript_19887/g.27568 Transcript_19887/m.27568 type:complete len:114 (+) Transcript_19887:93-434(+)
MDDRKMMFGLLFSLKAFVNKLDPTSGGSEMSGQCSFQSFRTNKYKLHYLENPSGISLVLMTDPLTGDLREFLRHVYSTCFTECVVKNPFYQPGQPFTSDQFASALNKAVRTHL